MSLIYYVANRNCIYLKADVVMHTRDVAALFEWNFPAKTY